MWMRIAILGELANHVNHFDRVSKTRAVETLLSGLDEQGVAEYVAHLQQLFLDCRQVAEEPKSTAQDPVSSRRIWPNPNPNPNPNPDSGRRIWVVDQMLALAKHPRVPKNEVAEAPFSPPLPHSAENIHAM